MRRNQRDDFSKSIKETLAKRAGTLCSNPDCCVLTFGPQMDPEMSVNIGVAAHIEGAAPGAARYNEKQSPAERSSIENGIWLCQNCAKLIDNDKTLYTVNLLKEWKKHAEKRAKTALGNKKIITSKLFTPKSILIVARQNTTLWPKGEIVGGKARAKITLRPISMPRDLTLTWIPLNFGNSLLPPSLDLFQILYQNQGKIIDEKIKIKLNFDKPAIHSISIDKEQRVQLIEGGGNNASFATFYIKESLPNERQFIKVTAEKGVTPQIEFWTKSEGDCDKVYIIDVIYET